MGALATNRQATAMPQAAVAAQIHQPLDVHLVLSAKVALDREIRIDVFAVPQDLGVAQVVVPAVVRVLLSAAVLL
jgi:hypothetical protein